MKFVKGIRGHKAAHHGGPYSIGNPDPAITDFSSNVNPLGYPTVVGNLLKAAKMQVSTYPDPHSFKLKRRLAGHLGVSDANLTVGNGATEIIYNFCRATIDKNTPVLIPSPTFGEYEAAARLCGGKLRFFKTMNLQNDYSEFIKKIPRNGTVFICNPNNPTGSLTQKGVMVRILDAAAKRGTHVFVDECFVELTPDPGQSLADKVAAYENLFVLRSFTKSFGLAGLRIGYGIGNKRTALILDKIKIPWNVSGLAQEAAYLALSDKKFIPRTQRLVERESEFLKKSISNIDGFACCDSKTNFILVKTRVPSGVLQKKLLQKRILVRDCSTFRGLNQNYIRVAVRTHRENLKLVRALRGTG